MKFWIVTPSYNQLEWLKLCIASVADQATEGSGRSALGVGKESITVHHHIQDAQSSDGTPQWLERYANEVRQRHASSAQHPAPSAEPSSPNAPASGATDNSRQRIMTSGNDSQVEASAPNAQCPLPSAEPSSPNAQRPAPNAYSFSFSSEKDEGMYDAINRGWKRAPDDVDVIAHLNCDEQYLPNALRTIAEFMHKHPTADVVLADMIVVDKEGEYICHRRSLKPYTWISRFCCAGYTATTFQRASMTKQKGVFFDTSWRNLGDKVWYNALHKAGCRFVVCNQLVSVFAHTGENLNWTDEGREEKKRYGEELLNNNHLGYTSVSKLNGLRRIIKELMTKKPCGYDLFCPNGKERIHHRILKPSGSWHMSWDG